MNLVLEPLGVAIMKVQPGMKLTTFHNLNYFNTLAAKMRKMIGNGEL